MVTQARTHYHRSTNAIPNSNVEKGMGPGEVFTWSMTPEEIKEYFATKYPIAEKLKEVRKKKMW